jgi:hypothetical protein
MKRVIITIEDKDRGKNVRLRIEFDPELTNPDEDVSAAQMLGAELFHYAKRMQAGEDVTIPTDEQFEEWREAHLDEHGEGPSAKETYRWCKDIFEGGHHGS